MKTTTIFFRAYDNSNSVSNHQLCNSLSKREYFIRRIDGTSLSVPFVALPYLIICLYFVGIRKAFLLLLEIGELRVKKEVNHSR